MSIPAKNLTCSQCKSKVAQVVWGRGHGGKCWACVKGTK